jgi:hypothetical protein
MFLYTILKINSELPFFSLRRTIAGYEQPCIRTACPAPQTCVRTTSPAPMLQDVADLFLRQERSRTDLLFAQNHRTSPISVSQGDAAGPPATNDQEMKIASAQNEGRPR